MAKITEYSYELTGGKLIVVRETYTTPLQQQLLITDKDTIIDIMEKGLSGDEALEEYGYTELQWEKINDVDTGWNPNIVDIDNYDKV